MPDNMESILEAIARNNNGRLPSARVLAKRTGRSEDEAGAAIMAFRVNRGEFTKRAELEEDRQVDSVHHEEVVVPAPQRKNPVRKKRVVGSEKEAPREATKKAWFVAAFDWAVDRGSLVFAVLIDLALMGIGFYIIGPDPLMKIAMVCIAIIIVLFSVRAWMKREHILWVLLASVSVFMDTSFTLLATDVQSRTVGVDTELERLKGDATSAKNYLKTLQDFQAEKGAGYATQIREQTAVVENANKALALYLEKPRQNESAMSASGVATAIPDAVMSGSWDRWIFLGLFLVVFLSLQWTIVSATGVKWK